MDGHPVQPHGEYRGLPRLLAVLLLIVLDVRSR
jgi:hypothetical protein